MSGMSVKDMADMVGVTSPTVRKRINDLGIVSVEKSGKALIYSFSDVDIILRSFGLSDEQIAERSEATKNDYKKDKEKKTKEKEKKKESYEDTLTDDELIIFLKGQIEALMEQIRVKDELLVSLNNKNDYLMAKQLGIDTEAERPPQIETKEKKKKEKKAKEKKEKKKRSRLFI